MKNGTRTGMTLVGGVLAAFASALCCAGPLLAVTLGVSGAGLATTFEPLRPYFLGVTAVARSSVSYDSASATIWYDLARVSPPAIIARLKNMTGYEAVVAPGESE